MTLKQDDNEKIDTFEIEDVEVPDAELENQYQQDDFDQEEEEVYETFEQEENKGKVSKAGSFIFDLVIYAIIIFVCIYIIPNYVMQRTIVDGSSMENTLLNGENLMVEKISYRLDMLDRFDIIVFYPYGRDMEEYYVKRIIGLPGETVQIVGSDILINGEVLEEHYGKDPITYAGIAYEPIVLGEDEYFVMGDNREISKDSRYPDVGTVSKENIGGRAIVRIWPLNKIGFIN
ncbi:MAG: hypothetical protein K0S47_877 [Herbinix sp.]|jgi:signal peptidase I|nr:hypothetical protein [Herbinix sp.]